ncbi:zf-CCHC domain-containing [Olea europaea subsp. europaea]|uniref:Zf-CCHC domain-containing, partial n=1 Tax=Olea europaea subsp. europaea TaxID=158383 RepID=A0A8S0UD79_OLEEU|nr:zf-CCHC domain-containing [Olea europaea subsp. europaea]
MALKAEMLEKIGGKSEYSRKNIELHNMSGKGKTPHSIVPDQLKPTGVQIWDTNNSGNTGPVQAATSGGREQARNYNSYAKTAPRKCYRCGKPRHRSNECPTWKPVNLVEQEEESGGDEEHIVFDDEVYDVAGGSKVEGE